MQQYSSSSPVYNICISELIRYSRACLSYQYFHKGPLLLISNLQNQGFLVGKLKSPLRNSYGRHGMSCVIDEYTRNTTCIRSGAGTAYIFGAHVSLIICVVIFDSCCFFLSFYFIFAIFCISSIYGVGLPLQDFEAVLDSVTTGHSSRIGIYLVVVMSLLNREGYGIVFRLFHH